MAHDTPEAGAGARLKVIFAGTPEFAVPTLEALLASPHEVCAVYTQPDRPAGRGRKLRPSPVKEVALARGIPVEQPSTLKDPEAQARLAAWNADLMVVVAYGLILPKLVLDTPRLGCVNVHASVLPRWRGAAPIQRAVLAGDAETGVTIMQMDVGLDTGPMLAIARTPIGPTDTAASLHDRLAGMGGALLAEVVERLVIGTAEAVPQDDALATYAAKLTKEEAQIDWRRPAAELERLIRGYNPWPVAYTLWGDETLRLWEAQALDQTAAQAPGSVLAAGKQGIDIATGAGVLRLTRLQPPGKKPMAAADFLNAHDLSKVRLGSTAV